MWFNFMEYQAVCMLDVFLISSDCIHEVPILKWFTWTPNLDHFGLQP